MENVLKFILIGILTLVGTAFIITVGYIFTIIYAMGFFDKDYSVPDLKDNFEKNKIEMYELKKFFNEIVPKNRFVMIEYTDNHTLLRFGIYNLNSTKSEDNSPLFFERDLKINEHRMDSIVAQLGWSRETLKTLKEKLDNVNCILIESGEPTKIGFQRSGLGMYSYNVFDMPIPHNEKAKYNDSCTYILATDSLVLEYGGGAFGSECFYNFK